jgi:hypothetical protein
MLEDEPPSKYVIIGLGPAEAINVVPKYKELLLIYKFACKPVTTSLNDIEKDVRLDVYMFLKMVDGAPKLYVFVVLGYNELLIVLLKTPVTPVTPVAPLTPVTPVTPVEPRPPPPLPTILEPKYNTPLLKNIFAVDAVFDLSTNEREGVWIVL